MLNKRTNIEIPYGILQFTHSFIRTYQSLVLAHLSLYSLHLPFVDQHKIRFNSCIQFVWHSFVCLCDQHVFIFDCIERWWFCLCTKLLVCVSVCGDQAIECLAFSPFNLAPILLYTYTRHTDCCSLEVAHVLQNIYQVLNPCGFRFYVLILFFCVWVCVSFCFVCLFIFFVCVIDWLFSHMLDRILKRRHQMLLIWITYKI